MRNKAARDIIPVSLFMLTAFAALGQTAGTTPTFEISDVHVSAKTANAFMRVVPGRSGRYEWRDASMVELIQTAYGVDGERVLGGPNWLEMDRFDVIARAPANAAAGAIALMLQALLADRFQLVVHKDTKALPGFALTAGKKPLLKAADSSGNAVCKPQNQMGAGGIMTIQFACRNMSMAAFAAGLGGMFGSSLGPKPIVDRTGLGGAWDFDVRWTMDVIATGQDAGSRITVFEALEKQLGLKLEPELVATPVIVVDRVNEKPSANPPGVAEALPAPTAPKAFDVADVKPSAPDATGQRRQNLPGGRLRIENMTMQELLLEAFDIFVNLDELANVPGWAETRRFDINAKVAAEGSAPPALDRSSLAPLLRSLLEDRFRLKTHTEERPVSAYTLAAGKPGLARSAQVKMKRADPAARTRCTDANGAPGTPRGTVVMTCQNVTMAQLAERLQNFALGYSHWPVKDSTGMDGGWDLRLEWVQRGMMPASCGKAAEGQAPEAPVASDPCAGLSLVDAVDRQLGLKLMKETRPMPVIVIDHLEEQPTDN